MMLKYAFCVSFFFFFSSRRRHTRWPRDWSSDCALPIYGEVLYQSDLPTLWAEVGPCIGIARSTLQQVLLAGADAVPCRLGLAVASLAQDEQQVSVGLDRKSVV